MKKREPSKLDLKLAKACQTCLICKHARKKQGGVAFAFVKTVETHVCPACRAYERVYGKKAHEK